MKPAGACVLLNEMQNSITQFDNGSMAQRKQCANMPISQCAKSKTSMQILKQCVQSINLIKSVIDGYAVLIQYPRLQAVPVLQCHQAYKYQK